MMAQKYESLFEYARKVKKEKQQSSDMVNAPKHYILTDTLQVKDVREAMLQKLMRDEIVLPYEDAHDWITAWEYITRAPFKNGIEDYRKAMWYLNNLLDRMEKRQGYVYDYTKDDQD